MKKELNQLWKKWQDSTIRQILVEKTTPLRQRWQVFQGKYPRPAWVIKWGGGALASAIAALFLFCLLVYYGAFGRLPSYADLRNIKNDTASEVYSDDGVLLGKYYVENRILADFEEISPNIIHALIATEDTRFFEHSGVDLRAFLRVLVKSILLFNDSSGGGSTLSQQLAKNLYPRKSYGPLSMPVNKVREMFIARRMEKLYTKEELLSLYLNTVPFSENVFGIKVAAQRFFSKAPNELEVEEAAVLVGMLKATTYYNPVDHPERAFSRRNTVLSQMAKYGYLEAATLDSLKVQPIELRYRQEGNNQGLATYFRENLRLEVEGILKDYRKPDGKPYNLYTDGLKVYTTIDARLQQYAEEAVHEHMAKVQKSFYEDWRKGTPWGSRQVLDRAVKSSNRYKQLKARGLSEEKINEILDQPIKMRVFSWENGEEDKEMSPIDSVKYYLTLLNAGFLAMEPGTGLIRAWVGGIDHKYFQYDHVRSSRQVGSTFKPVVYAQALRSGMLPCEYTYNRLATYTEYDNWTPQNSNGEYGGVYSMEGALSQSVNAVSVEILLRAGVDSVRNLARAMGVRNPIPPVPSIALGSVEASLLEMAQVYGTFANRGTRPELHYLDRIETSDGEVLVSFERPNPRRFKRALARDQADMMTHMLQAVVDSGTARRLRYEFGLYNDIAGKTGTTQNHSDGWFMGYTPNLVAGVWVGAELPSVHFRSMRYGQGSSTALPIFGSFLRKAYKNHPDYQKLRRAQFPALTDTLAALMSCPHYLEEMPIMMDIFENYYENPAFFEFLMREGIYLGDEERLQIPPPHNNETAEEYLDRLRHYMERLDEKGERREKRKQFWNNLLFGKDKKENEKPSGGIN